MFRTVPLSILPGRVPHVVCISEQEINNEILLSRKPSQAACTGNYVTQIRRSVTHTHTHKKSLKPYILVYFCAL